MSLAEKLQVMEELWTDLSKRDSGFSPPAWHAKVLDERQDKLTKGEIGFTDWELAKAEINRTVS